MSTLLGKKYLYYRVISDMKMKKVSIITAHPAPYMDVIFHQLSEEFDLNIIYNLEKSNEKNWKQQNYWRGRTAKTIKQYSILLRDIIDSDFIIICGWVYRFNIILIIIMILLRKKFSVWGDVPNSKRINFIKTISKKIIFRFIPYFFVTGVTGKKHYMKYYKVKEEKIKIFTYGIFLPDNKKILKINKKRVNDLEVKNENIKIFIANRFINRKGYKTVLKAFENLKSDGLLERFDISIIGNGEFYKKYKKLFSDLSNNIQLLGWVEFNEYNTLLDNCDVLIHASIYEPFGIPVIDSMIRGKLVLASSGVMSAIDLIENGVNGLIFEKGNDVELYRSLIYIEGNRSYIYNTGMLAFKKTYHDFFSHTKVLEECLNNA